MLYEPKHVRLGHAPKPVGLSGSMPNIVVGMHLRSQECPAPEVLDSDAALAHLCWVQPGSQVQCCAPKLGG